MKTQNGNKVVLFLIAGIPMAIGASLIELCQFGNLASSIIAGILGFLVLGGCLSVVSAKLAATIDIKEKAFGLWVIILVGSVVAIVLFYLAQLIPIQKWVAIEAPPEKPVSILHTGLKDGLGHLYVQTESGKIYRYTCQYAPESCSWLPVENIPAHRGQDIPDYISRQNILLYFSPIFPGKAIDSYQVIDMAGSSSNFSSLKVVLREDGSLFYWRRYLGSESTYPFYVFFYFLSGLTASISTFRAAFTPAVKKEVSKPSNEKTIPRRKSIKKAILLIVPGLIAGSGAGLLDFCMFSNTGTAVLVGSVAFFLAGCIFGLFERKLFRSPEPSKDVQILRSWLCIAAGFILMELYFFAAQYAPAGEWAQLPSPPEAVAHLLPSEVDHRTGSWLYVQAESGKTYMYYCVMEEDHPNVVKECKWSQTLYLLSGEECKVNLTQADIRKYFSPPSPAHVTERWQSVCGNYLFQDSFDDSGILFYLLEDGKILTWNRSINIYSMRMFQVGFAVFGILAGLVANKLMKSFQEKERSSGIANPGL